MREDNKSEDLYLWWDCETQKCTFDTARLSSSPVASHSDSDQVWVCAWICPVHRLNDRLFPPHVDKLLSGVASAAALHLFKLTRGDHQAKATTAATAATATIKHRPTLPLRHVDHLHYLLVMEFIVSSEQRTAKQRPKTQICLKKIGSHFSFHFLYETLSDPIRLGIETVGRREELSVINRQINSTFLFSQRKKKSKVVRRSIAGKWLDWQRMGAL